MKKASFYLSLSLLLTYHCTATTTQKNYPMIRDTRNMRGIVMFVNAQNRIDITNGAFTAKTALENEFHWDIRMTNINQTSSISNAIDFKRRSKATTAIFFIDDNKLPSLTSCPDDGVAIINVAKLINDNTEKRVANRRIATESLRAFAFSFGIGFSQYKSVLMSPVKSIAELDIIPRKSFYPYDTIVSLRTIAESLGLMPYADVYYETACMEGWAPAPTNDIQRAIWDRVHAVPKNPMKIEFDPKKGR